MAFIARRAGINAPDIGRRAAMPPVALPAARSRGEFRKTSGRQELVVVPLKSVAERLPEGALLAHRANSYVPVVPVDDANGQILFRAGDIQAACPHLFQPGHRLDPDMLIQIPVSDVFLGVLASPEFSISRP